MAEVPHVRILSAFAREVGTGALGAPLERVIVDRFPDPRVVAVAENVGHERADLLRMAVVTTFADVDIAAGEFQRRVRNLAMRSSTFAALLSITVGMI